MPPYIILPESILYVPYIPVNLDTVCSRAGWYDYYPWNSGTDVYWIEIRYKLQQLFKKKKNTLSHKLYKHGTCSFRGLNQCTWNF